MPAGVKHTTVQRERKVLNMGGKFYIGVDCEGVACAVGAPGQGLTASENYDFARLEATREADAAARALFDLGAEEVIVWDNHGPGVNLKYDLLDERCRIVLGAGHRGRFPGLDSTFAAVLFIGYHARENTPSAVLAHTYSSKSFQSWKLGGREVGELEIDAAFAGLHGVPVLFCASDDKCVAQAREAFGDIGYVVTKESLSWTSAISRHPTAVCRDIYREVQSAAARLPERKPFTLPSPLEVEIRYKRLDEAASAHLIDQDGKPFASPDPFTRRGVVESVRSLF